MNLWQRFKRLKFWGKLAAIGSLCSILAFISCLFWKLGTSVDVNVQDSPEARIQTAVNSPGSVLQQMQDSPGAIQVGGDLNVHPDRSKYYPINPTIRTKVLASVDAVCKKYGNACPVVSVTVESGSRNRDRVVTDVVNILKDAVLFHPKWQRAGESVRALAVPQRANFTSSPSLGAYVSCMTQLPLKRPPSISTSES